LHYDLLRFIPRSIDLRHYRLSFLWYRLTIIFIVLYLNHVHYDLSVSPFFYLDDLVVFVFQLS